MMLGPCGLGRVGRQGGVKDENLRRHDLRRLTVGPDSRVLEAAETMLANRISGVPVVGERGELVGIVSEGDLMRRAETHTERRRAWWLEAFVRSTTRADDYVQAMRRRLRTS
jgi:CBS-domain-containing membrane protein